LKQLVLGNYPCPIYNPFKNFKQIKSSYKPITFSSRIFALDVETVREQKFVLKIQFIFLFD
jgi:hypothetical protein